MAHHQNCALKGNQNVFQQLQSFNIRSLVGSSTRMLAGLLNNGENCSVLLATAEAPAGVRTRSGVNEVIGG